MIAEVFGTEQQNVHVAMELAMLKAIVEQMDADLLTRSLRQQPGLVALCCNKHRHLRFVRNYQRLVAELLARATGIDQKRRRGTAAVAARKHIDLHAMRRERFREDNH